MSNEMNHVGKAPMFNGTNYSNWKIRMSTHLKAMSFHIWSFADLAEIHEGTSEYNDAKFHFLKIQCETFSMLPHESVNDMYGRLNVIVNDLKGLGATYTDLEVAQKHRRRASPHPGPKKKGSSKVTSLSDSVSDDDCDDVSYDELVSMFEELHAYSEKEIVKFNALKKDHASLEVLYEELKTSHERLTISHEKLNSSSSSCVSICDTSLVVENDELKEQVAKLNKSLERWFKGKNTLDKILSEQRCILNKERVGFIPKKGKKPFHRATPFFKSNGMYCSKCREVGHLVNDCPVGKPSETCMFDSHYMIRKAYDGSIAARYVNYRTGGSHWVLDSGCTQHMTGDRAMFTTFEVGGTEQEKVTFGDSSKGKSIVAELFKKFAKRAQNEFSCTLVKIRSDNGSEYKNTNIKDYCDDLGIKHELSATYSPQQNGVVERKNHTLVEMASYASNSKAYRVYNKNKGIVEETVDVQFDETNGSQEGHENLDDVGDEGLMRAMKNMSIGDVKPIEVEDKPSTSTQGEPSTSAAPSQAQVEVEEEKAQDPPMPPRIHTALSKNHPIDQVLGDISKGVQTRSHVVSICEHYSFVFCFEPKHIDEALYDPDWINAMHEELSNFVRNKVWTLVERPRDHNAIGTKWVFRSKQDENGLVVRNKISLVAQGFTQVEAIRIILAFASCFDIELFQIDVKSAFLNGEIAELVFVEQPPGFEDPKNPNHDFKTGKVDTTLFTNIIGDDFFVCQIYVDDIIFGSTNEVFCKEFGGDMMSREFEMSMIGKLSFFLELHIKQLKDGTFMSQTKYIKNQLKRFGLEDAKPIKTPMATNEHRDLDEGGKPIDLKLYRSMIGSLLYLTASRSDIMFNVCKCARFQAAPKECHLVAVKRILRYLKYSSIIGLRYPKELLAWAKEKRPSIRNAWMIEEVDWGPNKDIL
uniref:Gag-pol polyprotein n=2 Tax=Oryza sativa subsp. japonica TaxID=39947 RepID=A0A5S6RA08_ORYSJ|nr:putative gag-pol polyprotein [Oryza sativa Japonica Group]AAO37839.1 putative retrotransposon protein [Oryza sativa Japonica Group]ABF97098.1 retrotransposon protein, putative, Ty1-copia subclass [Oryza sativa Japonica Group]